MKIFWFLGPVLWLFIHRTEPAGNIRLYTEPGSKAAYGLNITSPWRNGGNVFVNLPEHLEYMPDTKGIARHNDLRENVWQVAPDSATAGFSVESLTVPGVFLSVTATTSDSIVHFEMTITNRSTKLLKSIRPLLCFQYHHLNGFPRSLSDNFDHVYVPIEGRPVKLSVLEVKSPKAIARMAQVKGCSDEHNWWAEEMGGMMETRLDKGWAALSSKADNRKIVVSWSPGENLLANSIIPCIHADPCIGDIIPGASKTVTGKLVFTQQSLQEALQTF